MREVTTSVRDFCQFRFQQNDSMVELGSSSVLRAINLFCSCKFLGEAGTFLLVLEVFYFHPSPFPEVLVTLIVGVDIAYLSIAVGD